MIFWYTDNSVCMNVKEALEHAGIEARHISGFSPWAANDHIFYGILRGAGNAIKQCQTASKNFYYIDNGYFDAEYVNDKNVKSVQGKYRICRNRLIDVYYGQFEQRLITKHDKVLFIPPSQYSAYFHNTTPEDWLLSVCDGMRGKVRKKGDTVPLEQDIEAHDVIYAFNSMSLVKAIELGKPVYSTHGIVSEPGFYNYDAVKHFYSSKQFTLQEIAEGKWQINQTQ